MEDMMEPTGLEPCPVGEAIFAKLVRSSCDASRETARDLPEETRARLAIYCYRRAHLRRLGLTLAGTCSRQALVRESGHAGEMLFTQAQHLEKTLSEDRYQGTRHLRRPITLAH